MGFETPGADVPSRKTGEFIGSTESQSVRRFEVGPVTEIEVGGNLKNLNDNLRKLSEIPKDVVDSSEGQRETISLRDNISTRVRNFNTALLEKISKLEGVGDTVIGYAAVGGLAMARIPVLIQYARTQYPEVGIMLDSLPDVVQQVLHFDAIAKMFDHELGSIWKGGSAEVNNLLADISSGKVDFSSDQMGLLQESIGDMADTIKSYADRGETEVVQSLAKGSSQIASLGNWSFGNAPLFATVVGAVGMLTNKIGNMASNGLQERSK